MAPSKLRFQTWELSMRTIQRIAVSHDQQNSIQQWENRFRSGGMVYSILINKSQGFSKSLSGVSVS